MGFNPNIDFRIIPAWGKKRRCCLSSEIESCNYFVNIKEGEDRITKRIEGSAIRTILEELSKCTFTLVVNGEPGFDGVTYTLEFKDTHSITFEWWNTLPVEWFMLKPILTEIYRIGSWKDYPFEIA